MKITPELFLAKLAADPKIAAEFDAIHPGMSRRDHCVKVLNLVENTIAYNKAAKEKLIAAKARIAALERVKTSLPATKAQLAATRGKLIVAQSKASRRAAAPKASANSTTTTASGITSHSTRGGRAFKHLNS